MPRGAVGARLLVPLLLPWPVSPPSDVLVAHTDTRMGIRLPPALGTTGFMHPGHRGQRLLLPPITAVPALTPPPLRAASLRPLSPVPDPAR